jgi:hypothetical protein
MAKRLIIVGAMAARPWRGGHSWAYLNYVLGFTLLGLETYYVEYLGRDVCVDAAGNPAEFAHSASAAYFRSVVERFGLGSHAALLEEEGTGHVGLGHREIAEIAARVDLLINLGGRSVPESVFLRPRRRVYVDLDPGYTQIWSERYGIDVNLEGHDVYFTVGLNLGQSDCPVPTCGARWEKMLPPVVLGEWPGAAAPGPAYTTVAEWRGFSPIEWKGVWYGQKMDEFLRLLELPQKVSVPLELCLDINAEEPGRAALEAHGWNVVRAAELVADPDSYRRYIAGSRGEFTAVKHAYTAGRTGWFSDRSACYLAAGRPVVLQDTGIGAHVPTGAGLLTFTDLEGAAEALDRVEREYPAHAAAARRLAREHLDARRVLAEMLKLAEA